MRYIDMKYTMGIQGTVCLYHFFVGFPQVDLYSFLLGCWIISKFETERIVTEYLWVWLSGFFMITLYGIMFVSMRRHWFSTHGVQYNAAPYHTGSVLDVETDDDKSVKAIANSML